MKAGSVREAAVAGMFYPDDASELRDTVSEHLGAATLVAPEAKAVIAPHAGYVYSGPVAGSAFVQLRPRRDAIRRVVLIGPSHRVRFSGLAVPTAAAFATPLGEVPVDAEAVRRLLELPGIRAFDAAHRLEHSLEVELPFLQETLGEFQLVPVVTGDATGEAAAAALGALWGGPETLIVVSSDLSHYLPYAAAQQLDRATTRAIEQFRPQDIGWDQACGRIAIQGLLLAAQARGAAVRTLDLRNSGDTAGGRQEVVGYGAYAFSPS